MSHSPLRWPRSDGSSDNWVATGVENKNEKGTWYEKCSPDHPKVNYYAKQIGAHIAKLLNIPGQGHRMDLPKGYALFTHFQPRPSGEIREDVYLMGSENANKFRSWPEFQPHAEWLMDTTRPLDDHTTCECQYNNTSKAAKEKKQAQAMTSGKRTLDDDRGDGHKRQKMDGKDDSAVVTERAIDYRSQRRYRRGELIFFRIETIRPPEGSGLPEITHWPGLIANINEKTVHDGQEAEASLSTAWTMFGASAPDTLQKKVVKRTWAHSIRPLGMFATGHERHGVLTEEILPWSAGAAELLGGPEGWVKIGGEGLRVLNEGVRREAKEDPPKEEDLVEPELTKRWRSRWGERLRFDQMDRSWDAAVVRLSVGLQTGQQIAESWTQTDKINVIPPYSTLTPQDIDDIENNRKSLFQGVWLHGERIWLSDMVRIRKTRAELPVGSLLPPSPGAENRGVFLKVRTIALEVVKGQADESSAAPKDGPGDGRQQWRCAFYGDLFELAEGDEEAIGGENGGQEEVKPVTDIIKPKAPKGFHYRCLTTDAVEVLVDVYDLVGRCYPDLLEVDSSWFYSPQDPEKKGRVEASNAVMSLVGLHPCVDTESPRSVWKDDLYVIVRDAQRDMERDVRTHYVEALCQELNYRMPDMDRLEPKRNGHVNGNGSGNGRVSS